MPSGAFIYRARVRFSQTDAAGVVHFTEVLKWVEDAEHEFLVACSIPVMPSAGGGWPRVKVECDYRAPLRFGDSVEVRLSVGELSGRSIEWNFELWSGEVLAAAGKIVTVKVNQEGRAMELSGAEREALSLRR